MSQYSDLIGSFQRTSNFPIEANYIFSTEADLIDFYSDPVQKAILHEGLFKIVENDGTGKQALYWVTRNENNELEFRLLISGSYVQDLLPQLQAIMDNLRQEIEDRKKADEAIWGTKNQSIIPNELNSILNLADYVKKLEKQIQETHQEAFSALVKEAYYDSDKESLIIVFNISSGDTQKLEVPLTNLIREWEPDNSHPSKVVEIYRQEVYSGGADKLSADVRISSNLDNILEKDGNSLLVRGVTENITHNGITLNTVINRLQKRIKALEEIIEKGEEVVVPISITSFSMNIPSENEEGTVVNPIFTWTYNISTVDQQTLNGEQIDISLRTKQINNISSDTTVTLYSSYKGYTDSRDLQISFIPRVYYGVDTNQSISSIQNLSTQLGAKLDNTAFDCTGGKYVYYAIPSSYENRVKFYCNNFEVTAYTTSTMNIINSSNKTIQYTVFRLDNKYYGQFYMDVKIN